MSSSRSRLTPLRRAALQAAAEGRLSAFDPMRGERVYWIQKGPLDRERARPSVVAWLRAEGLVELERPSLSRRRTALVATDIGRQALAEAAR